MLQEGESVSKGQSEPHPLVSIIVPAYNRADLIDSTLNSICRQTWRPLEVVVVDDGSTDDTVERVRSWFRQVQQESDLDVQVICQDNAGAPTARNRGLAESGGDFILFLDSDDELHSEKVEKQVRALIANPSWDFCYGPVSILEDRDRVPYGYKSLSKIEAATRQLSWPFFTIMGPLIRRTTLTSMDGFNESLPCCQDWEFHTRLVLSSDAFGYVPGALAYYRQGDIGRSRISTGRRNRKYELSRKPYLRARLIQLRSAWQHASGEIRNTGGYRSELVWQTLRIMKCRFLVHGKNIGEESRSALCRIAQGTKIAVPFSVLNFLIKRGFHQVAWFFFALAEWVYYRIAGILGRFSRMARMWF